MKLRGIAALAAAAILALTGCTQTAAPGGDVPEFAEGTTMKRLADAGEIKVGTKFDQPLFGLVGPDGEPVGFDVEVAKLIAAKLGIGEDGVKFSETVSANREPFIENGNVDIVVATYTINDKRKEVVDFAGPYYEAGQALMTLKTNTEINGPDDLAGKVVCSVEGSTPAQYMRDNYPEAELKLFGEYSSCIEPLRNGQVDALTTDNVILAGFVAEDPETFQMVDDGNTFTKEPYGIGLKKGDTEFRNFINDTLEAAYADGSWAKAWEDTAGEVLPVPEPPAVDRY